MKRRLFKKRYIAMAVIAAEIAALPAAAHIMQGMDTSRETLVTAVEIPTSQPGKSRFMVVSDGPFTVAAENGAGIITTRIHEAGLINDSHYGQNAQLPGEAKTCAALQTHDLASVYQASRGTAAKGGPTLTRAVIMEFDYAPELTPLIQFTPGAKSAPPQACA